MSMLLAMIQNVNCTEKRNMKQPSDYHPYPPERPTRRTGPKVPIRSLKSRFTKGG